MKAVSPRFIFFGLCIAAVVGLIALTSGEIALLTPDQRAYRIFKTGEYQTAAERFADPMWKGVAWFEQGDFKKAEGIFAGFDTPAGAYNHGNALLMRGKYEEAVGRYTRALELSPDWDAARVNRAIALARAELLKKEGGDMTGGEMGADEIVFEKGNSPPSAGEETIEDRQEMSDAEMRSVWLRQVQTKPADFLRAKFAYQHATKKPQSD